MNQEKKELIKLNKKLLVGIVVSMTVSAMVAQLLSEQETYLSSTLTIVVGYAVFLMIFGTQYYIDSKKKFGTLRHNNDLKNELKKLITSLGVGEIFYLTIRWITLFNFLNSGIESYQASLISEVISLVSYMLIITISAKIIGLYRKSF